MGVRSLTLARSNNRLARLDNAQPSVGRYFHWLATVSNRSCATVVTLWIAMLLVAALLVCLYIDVLN
jgi:hypothetical protein